MKCIHADSDFSYFPQKQLFTRGHIDKGKSQQVHQKNETNFFSKYTGHVRTFGRAGVTLTFGYFYFLGLSKRQVRRYDEITMVTSGDPVSVTQKWC